MFFHAPLHEECLQHHGHKGDPVVTPGTCGAVCEKTLSNLSVGEGVGNASHPWRLGVTRVRHELCIARGVRVLECSRTP